MKFSFTSVICNLLNVYLWTSIIPFMKTGWDNLTSNEFLEIECWLYVNGQDKSSHYQPSDHSYYQSPFLSHWFKQNLRLLLSFFKLCFFVFDIGSVCVSQAGLEPFILLYPLYMYTSTSTPKPKMSIILGSCINRIKISYDKKHELFEKSQTSNVSRK